MKLSISTIAVGLMLAVVFTGCKKDKDDPEPDALHVGDTVMTIMGGALVDYRDGSFFDGYNLDLNLYGEGVTITETSPGYRSISGTGFRLYAEMFSETDSILADGLYAFNDTSVISPVETFDYADYTFDNDNGQWVDLVEGTIKVKKSGNNYELTINGKDENNQIITGYYNGPLQYFLDDENVYAK